MCPPPLSANWLLRPFLWLLSLGSLAAADFSSEQLEFFEKKIRPVLAEHCYSCHGVKKQVNALRLDSRDAVLKGGSYGPVVVPGQPAASKLVTAITHAKPAEVVPMPKDEAKLPDAVLGDIQEWIRQGLPWPQEAAPAGTVDPRSHWAFQPVKMPQLPAVKAADRIQQPLDAHVLAGLEKAGLSFGEKADRVTLLKRWTEDLLGLPATYAEIQAFQQDKAPDLEAAAKQVDRLLASPHFGERLGRYWLDVARYADTKGYVFQEERRYAYSYTFRDWVIRSLNQDMPYDDFLKQQLSADRRAGPAQKQNQAALGYLTLGRRFLNNQADIIDDRLDVVFRGMQGLTVGCARCHDHKFDPIPTADYYSLYGVFNSSTEPTDPPELDAEMNTPEGKEFQAAVQAVVDKQNAFRQGILTEARSAAGLERAVKVVLTAGDRKGDDLRRFARDSNVVLPIAQRLQPWLNLVAEGGKWIAEIYPKPPAEWPAKADAAAATAAGWMVTEWKKAPPTNQDQLVKWCAQLFVESLTENPRPELAPLHSWLSRDGGLAKLAAADVQPFFNKADRNKEAEFNSQIQKLKASHPGSPPKAMVLQDTDKPHEPRIFIRGNQGRPGTAVPRQFLSVLTNGERKPFSQGSGRQEMADAIASASNPLTSRVMVNRLAGWYLGAFLVDTPSDFGVRTAKPANPEMLDYLAAKFVEQGWSLKKIIREMLLSGTYGQSSANRMDAVKVDPENKLFWRMNRKRLSWEALRDSLLAASNGLDQAMFGRPVEMFEDKLSFRRSIYGFIDRQNLPGQLRTFDFASPDNHAPKRFETSVPQQALFMLNSPFILARAKELAKATSAENSNPADQVKRLFQAVLARDPEPEELAGALAFLTPQPVPESPDGTWTFGYGNWDPAAPTKPAVFTAMSPHPKEGWSPTPALPDPVFGYLHINGSSGHPGSLPEYSPISRWKCTTNATLDVKSLFKHFTPKGNGVKVRIVSSKAGLLTEAVIDAGKTQEIRVAARPVQAGEFWDFIVDNNGSADFDSYDWDPAIREMPTKRVVNTPSRATIKAPATLSPMVTVAQSLLCANEFVFMD